MRKYELTFLVLCIFYVNLYNVTYFEVGVVAKFWCGDDTVALVADVYDYFFLVCTDYGSLYYLMLAHFVESLIVGLVEVFLADIDSRTVFKLVPVEIGQRLYVLC